MALSKAVAKAIVTAVSGDTESHSRITGDLKSNSGSMLPDSWGISGAVRNWGHVLTGKDPTEKAVADTVCTGIADATSEAINRALKTKPGIPEIKVSTTIDRELNGVHHTATLVQMVDETSYVFDWHATLNVLNPMIFKPAGWKKDNHGVLFTRFEGFS